METRQEQVRNFVAEQITYKDSRVITMLKEAAVLGMEWADAHPQNHWISVEDKMPEEGKKVLLYSPALEMGIGWLVSSMARYNTFYLDGYGLFDEVTHWMPLPEKPSN